MNIRTDPPDATLFLDNAQVLNPFQAKLPKDSVNHRVVARADGEQEVVFDGTEVVLKLEERPGAGRKPGVRRNPRQPRRLRPQYLDI